MTLVPRPYNQIADPKRGNWVSFLGDSITTFDQLDTGYPSWAQMLSDNRIKYLGVDAHSGWNITQIATLLPTVYARSPKPAICYVHAGVNNCPTETPAVIVGRLRDELWLPLRAHRIEPIASTITPYDVSTYNAVVQGTNNLMRREAARLGIRLADLNAAVADTAIGANFGHWRANLTTDGLHPTADGAKPMGQRIADDIAATLPNWSVPVARYPSDPTNLIGDGLFSTASGTVPNAPIWVASNYTGVTASTWETDANALGQWWKMTKIGGASNTQFQSPSMVVTPGDVMCIAARVQVHSEISGVFASPGLSIKKDSSPFTTVTALYSTRTRDFGPNTIYREGIVPAGVTSVKVFIDTGLPIGSYVRLAQLYVGNLTAQGLS